MNDPLLVRVLNGVADLNEQLQPLFGIQLVFITVAGDGNAPHQFHDKEWSASFGGAGVQHLGNVGWSIKASA